ncbi:MAG: cyanophycin synthetase family protein [Bacteroidia bacterium]
MNITSIKLLRGPNCWSIQQKYLVVAGLLVEEITAERLRLTVKRAMQLFPELAEKHKYAQKKAGIPELVKCIALELQCRAGMNCLYSELQPGENQGEHLIIFSYTIEKVGLQAIKAAVKIVDALIRNEKCPIQSEVNRLIRIKSEFSTGPTTLYILNEVIKRNIPYRQFDNGSLLTLGYGSKQRKTRTAVADTTSGLGMELAGDKEETKRILAEASLPIPRGIVVFSEAELKKRIQEVRFPVVIKPLDGNHGRGVTTEISTIDRALFGYAVARIISEAVIVEEFIPGEDYRFLIINYKLVAVAKRTPALIVGDGTSTIHELVTRENENPQRGDSEDHVLAPIKIDAITQKIMLEKKLTLDSVLASGQILTLKDTANISAGGTATDVTDLVHPENAFLAERVARMFNLDICGLDIVATAVDVPLTRDIGAIIEVNAGPGLRMHSNPQKGTPRNVAAPILDMLFPDPLSARIPIIAVHGNPLSGMICRIIAHIAKQAGNKPGCCSVEGIFINDHHVYEGNCTGYLSAQDVLFDPIIDIAVLECGSKGIRNRGLAFDQCDVSVVPQVEEEEDLRTCEVLVWSTDNKGYVVLDADNELSYGLKDKAHSKVALYSMDNFSDRIRMHCSQAGVACVIEKDPLLLYVGNMPVKIAALQEIPFTGSEKDPESVKAVLASVLAASINGFSPEMIRQALLCLFPLPILK